MNVPRVAVAVMGGAIAIATISAGLTARAPSADRDQRALRAYASAIRPFQRAGGQVVAEEIRPRLADIELGAVTADQFRVEATAWKQKMESVRRGIAAVKPPTRVKAAAHLYDVAMRQYQAAIDAFVVAVGRPPAELKEAITAAVPLADRADATYDRADKLVDAALVRAGVRTATLP